MSYGRYYEEFEIGQVFRHWPGRTIGEAILAETGALGAHHNLLSLVVADMLEHHDACIRMLGALAFRQDRRLAAQGVADTDRIGKSDLFVAEISEGRPQREV